MMASHLFRLVIQKLNKLFDCTQGLEALDVFAGNGTFPDGTGC